MASARELGNVSMRDDVNPRFLSQADCRALTNRIVGFTTGGGVTTVKIQSDWTGNIRWARNQVITSGDVRDTQIDITRSIRNADGFSIEVNQSTDRALEAAVRRAEAAVAFSAEEAERQWDTPVTEAHTHPSIWSDATYTLDAAARMEVAQRVMTMVASTGMHAAGYLEVSAHGRAIMTSDRGDLYYPYTQAQFSVTVRDPAGTASGWVGLDWHDWRRIDVGRLSAVALDKCLRSRNAVAVEPGRYTTILEPQAVADLWHGLWLQDGLTRHESEDDFANTRTFSKSPPTHTAPGFSKIGDRIIDARVTITMDPMDPELGCPPFDPNGVVFHPVVWIDRGVLANLGYFRSYAVAALGRAEGRPGNGAFRMSGGTETIEDMIATTTRGILVTRLSDIELVDMRSFTVTGYTRDGLWLIEHGRVAKAIKNFRFTDSPLLAFNNIEQLGVPQRVFHPTAPVVVPPVKVRDFNFVGLADAV